MNEKPQMNKSYSRIKLWFDRLLSKSLLRQFAILGVVLFFLFLISWFFLHISGCNWKDFAQESNISEWLLPLYLLIDTNAFSNLYMNGIHGWALVVSTITFIIGVFIFNGMIISIMTNAIEQRVQNHQEGHLHYLKSGHYIIMGYDEMVPSIIARIFEKDADAFVLLMSAAEAPHIKEKLKKCFNEKQLKQIIINYGHRMSKDYYKDIHLESSAEIFIVGLRSISAHDAINVECVDSICKYLKQLDNKERPKRITCVFEDLDTYAAFKTSEIFGEVKDLGIEFIPYNFYAGWAKQVFVKRYHKDMDNPGKKVYYPAVYGNGITPDDPKYVHLVFIGTTYFAVAFAMEAAHVLHFPNFRKKGVRTLITFIDINSDKEKDVFIARNRHFFEIQPYYYCDLSQGEEYKSKDEYLRDEYVYFNKDRNYQDDDSNFLDVEFEFIKGDIFSKNVQNVVSNWAKDKDNQYLSIFLALADQRTNFAFGMNMPDEVYDNEIPIFIRQDRSDNFVSNLRAIDEALKKVDKKNTYAKVVNGEVSTKILGGRYANIYPFGMNEVAYCGDEKSLARAKLINYLYCTANYSDYKFQSILVLDSMPKTQIEEEANRLWRDLSVALKWSNLYNAYTIRTKLATLQAMRGIDISTDSGMHDIQPLSDNEVEELGVVEHNRWNVEKLLMGYRKPHKEEDKYAYPEYANELKKNKEHYIHHDIRPFKQLGSVKELDYEFSRYIPWLMRMTENR